MGVEKKQKLNKRFGAMAAVNVKETAGGSGFLPALFCWFWKNNKTMELSLKTATSKGKHIDKVLPGVKRNIWCGVDRHLQCRSEHQVICNCRLFILKINILL